MDDINIFIYIDMEDYYDEWIEFSQLEMEVFLQDVVDYIAIHIDQNGYIYIYEVRDQVD